MYLAGCGTKSPSPAADIPEYLLEPPEVPFREVKTQNDVGLLLIDLQAGYEKCTLQLKTIKEISDESKD